MSKYINAEQLEKDGWTLQRTYKSSPTEMVYETKKPTDFPSADVAKVRHGQWIDTGSGQECSVCGEVQYGYDSGRHYCPNCGAKMDGDENKELSKVSEMEMAYGEYLND